jgi:hypothetical protein
MKLLSFIREKAEVHRVWLGGTREEDTRHFLGKMKKEAVFFGEERKSL